MHTVSKDEQHVVLLQSLWQGKEVTHSCHAHDGCSMLVTADRHFGKACVLCSDNVRVGLLTICLWPHDTVEIKGDKATDQAVAVFP